MEHSTGLQFGIATLVTFVLAVGVLLAVFLVSGMEHAISPDLGLIGIVLPLTGVCALCGLAGMFIDRTILRLIGLAIPCLVSALYSAWCLWLLVQGLFL